MLMGVNSRKYTKILSVNTLSPPRPIFSASLVLEELSSPYPTNSVKIKRGMICACDVFDMLCAKGTTDGREDVESEFSRCFAGYKRTYECYVNSFRNVNDPW